MALGSRSVNIRKLTNPLIHIHKYIVIFNVFHVNMAYSPMADLDVFLDTIFYIYVVTDCRNSKLVVLLIRTVRAKFFTNVLEVTHLPVKFYLLIHSIR